MVAAKSAAAAAKRCRFIALTERSPIYASFRNLAALRPLPCERLTRFGSVRAALASPFDEPAQLDDRRIVGSLAPKHDPQRNQRQIRGASAQNPHPLVKRPGCGLAGRVIEEAPNHLALFRGAIEKIPIQ